VTQLIPHASYLEAAAGERRMWSASIGFEGSAKRGTTCANICTNGCERRCQSAGSIQILGSAPIRIVYSYTSKLKIRSRIAHGLHVGSASMALDAATVMISRNLASCICKDFVLMVRNASTAMLNMNSQF